MTIDKTRRLLIICEGYEEWVYMKKLLSFPFYNKDIYSFDEPINAKSNSKIVPRFISSYSRSRYDLILIFCDGDRNSNEFQQIKKDLSLKLFGKPSVADDLFIYVNPVTLQIVLSHYGRVNLTHIAKSKNADEVLRLTGIKRYDAKEEQIERMINGISFKSFEEMLKNIKDLPDNPNLTPSSNFFKFIKNLQNSDSSWIDIINKKLN